MRIAVPGRELKSTFKDISGLLRKYEQAKVVGVSTDKEKITFTVDAGTYYTRSIEFTPIAEVMEVSLTVMFADLSHFINGRDEARIELTEYFMQVTSKGVKMSLNIGESIVAPYQPRGGRIVDLNFGTLKSAVGIFSKTTDLQKAFSREFAVSFYGDKALMKAPTIWIETQSQGLECVLSVEQMKSIVMFLPDKVEVSDRLEFRKGNAILSIPCTTPTEQNHFGNHVSGMTRMSVIDTSGIVRELQELKRVIGVGECTVSVSDAGLNLRIDKSGISVEKSYGIPGDSNLYFRYPLDLFIMCLNLLGEDLSVEILWKEGLVCLTNTVTSILLSVLT